MFDQADRGAKLVIHVEDKAAHVLFFLNIHPSHRFVEQQYGRLGGQGASQFHALFEAIGQAANRCLSNALNFKKVDDAFDFFTVFHLFIARLAPPERLTGNASVHVGQTTGHDVVQNSHTLEQRNVLKGPGHSLARDFERFHWWPLGPFVPNLTFRRRVEPRNHVKH